MGIYIHLNDLKDKAGKGVGELGRSRRWRGGKRNRRMGAEGKRKIIRKEKE